MLENETSNKPKPHRHSWTSEEIQFLKDNYNNYSFDEFSEILNIKSGSIKSKANDLGLYEPPYRRYTWSDDEIKFISENYQKHTVSELAEILGLNSIKVRQKLYSMGLNPKKKIIFSEDGTKKRCSVCKEFKELSFFGKSNDKIRTQCKSCEYNSYIERKFKKSFEDLKKPTFEDLIAKSRKERFCTKCNVKLNSENCIIITNYTEKRNKYELASLCKSCQNEIRKENKIKLIAKRGY